MNYVCYWDACRFTNWLDNGQPTGAQGVGTTETGAYTLNGYDGRTIQRNAGWTWAVTSEDEWYKAAWHKNDGVTGNYFDYPTSSNTAPGRDLADASGNNANYYDGDGSIPIDPRYYTTVVGEFQDSDSPYGTFDQGGNVWEWTEAVIIVDGSHADRVARGTSAYMDVDSLRPPPRDGCGPGSASESPGLGFRVSEVPEPATLALPALGGPALLRHRRSY